jgi:hypothetical protein
MANARVVLPALVICVFLLVIGLLCLFWPESVRSHALGASTSWNPFLGWMRTSQYLWSLRIIGALALAGFLLIAVGFLRTAL